MTTIAHKPTDEQVLAIDLARQLLPLKINAFAGSGKTSTLEMIGRAMPQKRGLYCAFNKMIVEAAKARMPESIHVRTMHSLAFREFGVKFAHRLNKRPHGHLVARTVDIRPVNVQFKATMKKKDGMRVLSGAFLGGIAISAVERFCCSTESRLTIQHIPRFNLDGIDRSTEDALREQLVPAATKLWQLMSDINSDFPSSHSVYLKLWADSEPIIRGYDYFMFDEAQDADGQMLKVLGIQKQPVIYVGDRYQAIYSWRGAVNALEKIKTPNACNLSLSFRFGHAIAEQANLILSTLGETATIYGNPAVLSTVAPIARPKAILCRTNAEVVEQLFKYAGSGLKVAATGTGETRGFFQAAQSLLDGKPGTGRLSLFNTWYELVEYSRTESGQDLAPYVKLTDDHGVNELLHLLDSALDATVPSNQAAADVAISTAHRAKGMEWDSVCLASDFRVPGGTRAPSDEEIRLLYVAATRAKHGLDLSLLETIDPIKHMNGADEDEDAHDDQPGVTVRTIKNIGAHINHLLTGR